MLHDCVNIKVKISYIEYIKNVEKLEIKIAILYEM